MSVLEAIVLGIVQGLTEFLPISSSAHLRIVPELFGWDDPGASFTAVIQLGTMAAVVIYFWGDLWRIAGAWLASLREPSRRGELDARMGWYLIVATVPIVIFGFAFADQIETGARDLRLIAYVVAVSLLLHPAITWTLGRALDLGPGPFRSAVVTAGMAPGVNAYLFVSMYGSALRVAASSVLIATVLCIVTAWGWMQALG